MTLAQSQEDIILLLDESEDVDNLCFYFRQAFDSVPHEEQLATFIWSLWKFAQIRRFLIEHNMENQMVGIIKKYIF